MRLGYAQPLYKSCRRGTLSRNTQRREWREQISGRSSVDEIRVRDQGSRKPNDRPV
jgi:hypothetical protein